MLRYIFLLLFLPSLIHGQGNEIKLTVLGSCGMCQDRIEKVALKTIGVVKADYDLDTYTLTLKVDANFHKNELVDALLLAGHDADGQKAKDDVYAKLPECCNYRQIDFDTSLMTNSNNNHSNDEVIQSGKSDEATNSYTLEGVVKIRDVEGKDEVAIGANIFWLDNPEIGTISDLNGSFKIKMLNGSPSSLIVNVIGFKPDTIYIEKPGIINIIVTKPIIINGIEIVTKKRSTEVSYLSATKVQQISSKELLKAACCNLAESFDTTPSIDASVTDAITGTRKIEMLGLAGPYVQITRENIPDVRGLAALQGLNYTPGAWVESMQLNMGAGSVVNGYESVTGQINVELRKPCHEEKMHLNMYISQAARIELNTFNKQEINENWGTATLLHASTRLMRRDHNEDGFLDMPLGKQFGFINRWKWTNNEGQEGQIGVKLSYLDNISGQNDFDPIRSNRQKVWGADMSSTRAEIWAKRGFVNLNTPYKTLGFQFSGIYHDQKSQFGIRRYDATQKSIYFNTIYQTILNTTDHQLRFGGSIQWDRFNEKVVEIQYLRNEFVPGVFGEYTYKNSEKWTVLAGIRADHHNNFGLFITPRLNLRYAPNESLVFRINGGRGQKTASIFAENIGYFASNREIVVRSDTSNNTPYGLGAEIAWNVGFSATKDFRIGKRNLFLSFDANRINFENQIVIDLDESAQQVIFYNLAGKSYSNSFQFICEIDAMPWLDIRVAYRYNDVKTTYGNEILQKPMVSAHRAFANFALNMGKGWSFDYTINRLSSVRLPSTLSNNESNRLPSHSPSYFLSNTQISKKWTSKLELYLGGENIFDYRLDNPIISASNPFSPYFDSSLAWGPIMGVNIYFGVRYGM